MNSTHKFMSTSRMSDIVIDEPSLISIISRFGISLGFGDKNIAEVCESNQIHTETFLAVINFIAEGNYIDTESIDSISIETVITFLKNSHGYFLSYKLPAIRTRLISAVENSDKASAYRVIILKFFDEYFDEVRKHMEYEDKIVFPYVMQLVEAKKADNYRIADFEEHHSEVDSKLAELKNILIKYFPSQNQNYQLNDVLYDLLWCEKDLASHNQVEDYFFVPVILDIENRLIERK